jgi:tetratricopeptide (TPR) repeat protein
VLTLLRFGRFDEVLEVRDRPRGEIEGALWDFAQGYAQLRQGNADFAGVYLARVKKTADTSKAAFRVHSAKDLLSIVAGILEGEMQRSSGQLTAAIATFEKAAAAQESLVYDEPEPLPFSAFHWLGAALLEARRYDDAEQAYRRELKDHPKNGWSLIGILQAREANGASTADVKAEFDASWMRSDTWIAASRF